MTMTIQATQGMIGGAVVETKETIDAAADAAITDAILPDPSPLNMLAMSGDPGAEIAALAVKSGEQQQTNAQAARDADRAIEVSEDQQQVAAMNQKADEIQAGGLASGLGMIAEGGFNVAAAGLVASDGKESLNSAALKFDGTVLKAGASMNAATDSAFEANADASAAAAKSASDQAKSAADDENDAKKSAGDFINAALDFYKEYTSAQASANSAAIHRA
jgi:hypothetical protein